MESAILILDRPAARLSRREFGAAAAAMFCAGAARAQDDAVFSTDVKVVNILASVRNKKGELIRDLTKDDFALTENGKPQTIRYFARETNLPLTLGLMIDTSTSQEHVMDAERGASFRFLDEMLRDPKDQAFIMQFDIGVLMRQRLTSSRRDLEESLSQVDTPTRQELRMQTTGGTRLYDAILTASREPMTKLMGRKALIVLSDGVDTGSESTLSMAVDAALRSDTLVYSILYSDPSAYGFLPFAGKSGRDALRELSVETGGKLFEVSKKTPLEQIFDQIQDELRGQYNLGFVSDQPVEISEFRKLALATKQKGLQVQARERYWAQR